MPYEVFISYAHEDRPLLNELTAHLSILQRQKLISTWQDTDISPGTVWQKEIMSRLNSAQIILLLISADFINSDFAYSKEMGRAIQRHKANEARVIPIILRPVYWKGAPFDILDVLPMDANKNVKPITSWNRRDDGYYNVVEGIARAIDDLKNKGKAPIQNVPSPHDTLSSGRDEKTMQKIKALFLAANPASMSQLAIDKEMRTIEQKVRAAEHRDALEFKSAWAVQPDDLLQLLNQHKPYIVHFSGHGSSEGLSLVGDNGQERLVTTRALKALFTTLRDNIRLVFLNSCYSSEQAQALVETIDCVIGMNESIRDDAAIAFASSFYRAIGFGRSVQEAFEQGITSLLLEGIPDEDLPELLVKQGVDARKVTLIASANP